MEVSASAIGVAYLVIGIGILALVLEPLRHPDKPESPWIALTIFAFALWLISLGVNYQIADLSSSLVAWNGRYIAATAMSVGWFLLGIAYVTQRRPTRIIVGVLGLYLLVDVAMVVTNAWHGLVLAAETGITGTVPEPVYASWFWFHTGVNYLFVLGATVLFVIAWTQADDVRRRQSALLSFGLLPPFLANMATLTGLLEVPYDFTPLGLAVTALLLTYAIYRMELLDVVPIARETAVEQMRDAVVTLDAEDRVVDANASARRLFDVGAGYVGTAARDFFTPIDTDLDAHLDGDSEVDTRMTTYLDGERRHFSLSISPVGTDGEAGRVVVLRDVTPIVRRERALQEREGELDLLRQVLTRVLTHNVRNALTTIHGNAELLADSVDEAGREQADAIVDASDDLLRISDKVRHVERILADEERLQYDISVLVADAVAAVREEYPEVEFSVDTPSSCEVESSPGLDAAVEALIENAAEYNDPDEPRVEIVVDPDGPTLTVSDRGPGIPQDEVDVLEAERETPLQHGSGIGLWLVKWVADHSGAELSFSRSPDGTTVTVSFEGQLPEHASLLE